MQSQDLESLSSGRDHQILWHLHGRVVKKDLNKSARAGHVCARRFVMQRGNHTRRPFEGAVKGDPTERQARSQAQPLATTLLACMFALQIECNPARHLPCPARPPPLRPRPLPRPVKCSTGGASAPPYPLRAFVHSELPYPVHPWKHKSNTVQSPRNSLPPLPPPPRTQSQAPAQVRG